jgi:hypothetical protein
MHKCARTRIHIRTRTHTSLDIEHTRTHTHTQNRMRAHKRAHKLIHEYQVLVGFTIHASLQSTLRTRVRIVFAWRPRVRTVFAWRPRVRITFAGRTRVSVVFAGSRLQNKTLLRLVRFRLSHPLKVTTCNQSIRVRRLGSRRLKCSKL